MKDLIRHCVFAVVLILCALVAAAEYDFRDALQPSNIDSVRVNLEPAGAQLGFEGEIAGDDHGLDALIAVIRDGKPGGGHKCPNSGDIRFRMKDGSLVGVGLLPSHEPGVYGLRLYDGERFVAVVQVERAALLEALAGLGVPTDDPAFRE